MPGTVEYPEITFRSPILTAGSTSAVRPNIVFDWNIDIVSTTFSSNSTRPLFIQILNESTGTLVPTSFVSYDTGRRRVTLIPDADLTRDTTYTVVVSSHVPSTIGRKSKNVFRWQFSTAVGAILTSVNLINPADYTINEIFPTLSWSVPTATGTITYTVEVDDGVDFVAPIYTTTTTATSITPSAGPFTQETTYYWRVLATTITATGIWSNVGAFYYGTIRQSHLDNIQTWNEADSFGLIRTSLDPYLTHQFSWPTISFTFSSAPSGYTSYLTVVSKSLGPRNDNNPTSYQESTVLGAWTLSASTLTFTPSGSISENTRYEVRISEDLFNTQGVRLDESLRYSFTGYYTPYFCDIRDIRARFLSAGRHVPDDLINFYIYKMSLEAKAKYYVDINGLEDIGIGDILTEDIVRDSTDLRSFGVGRWVESAATYTLIKSFLFELTQEVDSRRTLGDFTYELGPGVLKALELAMKIAKDELDNWGIFLVPPGGDLTSAIKSHYWSPWNRDLELGLYNFSDRDNGFGCW